MKSFLRPIAASGVLFAGLIGGVLVFRQSRDADNWVVHTLQVQELLTGVLSRLQDAETGQRGYVLTQKLEFLEPYAIGRRALVSELKRLQLAVADNPIQRALAANLLRCSDVRVHYLERGIARVAAGERETAVQLVRQGRGQRVMDHCRAIVAKMKRNEQLLLGERLTRVRLYTSLIYAWFFASALIVLGIALYVVNGARSRAEAAERDRHSLAQLNTRLEHESRQREAAQAELQKLMKMESIGQLAAGIAHDFNNMLAIIMGSLDLLRRRTSEEDLRSRAQIDAALSSAKRAAQLTAQLLAFGRRQTLVPKIIDCGALVVRSAALLRTVVGKSVTIETTTSPMLWRAYVDPTELETALVNLCLNAREAMPEGGRLLLASDNVVHAPTGRTRGEFVRLIVRDWGTGMTEAVQERAFEPFFTTKGRARGSGMGLSQVYGFVRQSGGHIELQSTAGRGTEIRMYLPRYVGEGALEPDQGDGAVSDRRGSNEIILVVDDEQQIRDTVAETLRELGYLVVNCTSAQSALELLLNGARIDLLLTDIVMPGMSGIELAERVRSLHPEVKILLMSGYSHDALADVDAGAQDFDLLRKPFTIAALAARVRTSLAAVAPLT